MMRDFFLSVSQVVVVTGVIPLWMSLFIKPQVSRIQDMLESKFAEQRRHNRRVERRLNEHIIKGHESE
jgi:tRNA G10  N-methylase Trm11